MRRLIVVLAAIGLLTTPAALGPRHVPGEDRAAERVRAEGIRSPTATRSSSARPRPARSTPAACAPAPGRSSPGAAPVHARGDRESSTTAASCGSQGRPERHDSRLRREDGRADPRVPPYAGSADVHQRRRRDEEGGVLHGFAATPRLARHRNRQAGAPGDLTTIPLSGGLPARRGPVQPQRHRRHRRRQEADRRPDRREEALPDRSGERRHQGDRHRLLRPRERRRPAPARQDALRRPEQLQPDRRLPALERISRRPRSSSPCTDPDFDVPTTIDKAGKRLYAVNARFGTSTPTDQHYDIVKVG